MLDDEALALNAHRALANVLGIAGEPEAAHVHRFPRAMPQYPVGFRDDLRRIEACLSRHEGLLLCGTAKGDFGIPDCVSSGEAAAQRAWPRIAVHGEPAAIRASFAG